MGSAVTRTITLAAALLVAACASMPGGNVSIPVKPIGVARIPNKPLTGTLAKPDGPGPFPAIIVLHGCGGISPGIWLWQARLIDWGYAVLVLDSFEARNVSNVCAPTDQPRVTPIDRAGDVVNAALLLQTTPGIDGRRVGVVGLSHGGATAARVTQKAFATPYPGLIKGAVDYYGSCGDPRQYGGVPLLSLAGEADDWGNPASNCREFGSVVGSHGTFLQHAYPGVVHSFENPRVRPSVSFGHSVGYDDAAAEDSFVRTRAFLDQWVKGGRT